MHFSYPFEDISHVFYKYIPDTIQDAIYQILYKNYKIKYCYMISAY